MYRTFENVIVFMGRRLKMKHNCGQLSRADLINELNKGKLIIEPRNECAEKEPKIKTASFDISPSCLIMSVKRGSFMKIYSNVSRCEKGHRNPEWRCVACKKSEQAPKNCTEQLYTYIPPRDTALVLSKEYLQIPEYMSGNVYSRVSTVSSGLGHISTTIDPLWKGALLIAISNPSSEPIKLMLQDGQEESVPLATVTLQYLNTPVDSGKTYTTHLPARVDILERYLFDVSESKRRSVLFSTFWYRFWHIKDYHLTVRLIERLKKMKDIQPVAWEKNLRELEEEVRAQKVRGVKWRHWLMGNVRWLRKIILIVGLVIMAYMLHQVLTAGLATSSDFIGPIIIAVLECILALLLAW